jgi:hypothetical protein
VTVVVICGLLVVVGLLGVARWGGTEVEHPEPGTAADPVPAGDVARRYLRLVTLAVASGTGAGLLVAGPGGRLAMRLLAATAGDAAQGRETEAEEIVGRITAGGTIGFVIFTALFFGAFTGILYLVIRRWLPAGRLGGVAFGGLLLVLAATRIEPLRSDNPDFDLVGPGWVALVVFSAVVVVHGMLVAAIAGRYSRVLPLPSPNLRAMVPYAPLLLMVPVAPVFVILVLVGVVVVALSRLRPLVDFLRSGRALLTGRLVLAGAGLLALPGWVVAVVDIAGRQP